MRKQKNFFICHGMNLCLLYNESIKINNKGDNTT